MTKTITVSIIGLERTGSSVALALRRCNRRENAAQHFEITGADPRPGILETAKKAKLCEKLARDVAAAARGRDIVVLALPLTEQKGAWQGLARGLQPGAVVLDLALLKGPALSLAQELLPEEAHLVQMTPVVNARHLFDGLDDAEHASEDLFDKSSMMLMPAPDCTRAAVELASDFSTLLGATVHFMDPLEHDSLMAATVDLPAVLGVAGFRSLARSSGWTDMQRLTNPPFGRLTHVLYDTHPDDLRDRWLHNREPLLRRLDDMLETLQQTRDALAEADRDALEALLDESSGEYSAWINRRHNNRWDEDERKSRTPSPSSMLMSGLMGDFLSRRLRGENHNED